jgi:vancomycin resistance protein YoaR
MVGLVLGVVALEGAATAEAPPTVLGRFMTSYVKDEEHKGRAFNVELAAEAVDGRVVGAGATFSFNDAVGERTAAFGFAKGNVIRDRMMAEGTGGGTCQVASTLYAAALLAGLDVVSRAPHSRPSAYIRMGFDATVAFPRVDLRLKNPSSAPLTIRAQARHGALDVWLEARGAKKPDVTLTSEILERMPFERVVQRDRTVDAGTEQLRAFGIPGYRVRRVREIKGADDELRRDVRIDVYPPTSEVVALAPSSEKDDESAASPSRVRVVDPQAVRPALVQLRPSTMVQVNNLGLAPQPPATVTAEP